MSDVDYVKVFRNVWNKAKAYPARSKGGLFLYAALEYAFDGVVPDPAEDMAYTAYCMMEPVVKKAADAARKREQRARTNHGHVADKSRTCRGRVADNPISRKEMKGKEMETEVSLREREGKPSFDQVKSWAVPAHKFEPVPDEAWLRSWYDELEQDDWRCDGQDLLADERWKQSLGRTWRADRRRIANGEPPLRGSSKEALKKNFRRAPADTPSGPCLDDDDIAFLCGGDA